jgi:hypothetical protein
MSFDKKQSIIEIFNEQQKQQQAINTTVDNAV